MGLCVIKVNLHGVVFCGNHPEDVVAIDVYVVIVDLRWERGRSNRTGVQIESNKDLGAMMHVAVCTNKFAFTETHVRLICQRRGRPSAVCPRTSATNMGQSYEAIEICNLRRVVDTC